MRIVRSLEAVYRTPLPPIPPPPHLTTLTLAEWPPSAYSSLLAALDHTRTLPSFEEDASLGAVEFLRKPRKQSVSLFGSMLDRSEGPGQIRKRVVSIETSDIIISFSSLKRMGRSCAFT